MLGYIEDGIIKENVQEAHMEWWIWLMIIGVVVLPFRLVHMINELDKRSKAKNKHKNKK